MTKIALITGAGRGIGAATALLAAKRGYQVAVNYHHSRDAALQVVQAIREGGGKAEAYQADVAQEAEVVAMFEAIDRDLGPITALVNNAGTLEAQSRVEAMDAARLHRIFAINVIGSFLCAREAIKRMTNPPGAPGAPGAAGAAGGAGSEAGREAGAIVNVSSVAARTGAPSEYVDYAASKGAIDAMTLGLAKELAPVGIRVNAVRPGFIYTDIHARGGEPNRVDRIKDTLPMRRGGHPEEVAQAILWLLSDAASYVTGTFIDLAGGR